MLVTTFYNSIQLREYLKESLRNISDIEVKSFQEICADLHLKHDWSSPRESVNKLIEKLSETSSDTTTLLLMDEVLPCCRGQTDPNWSELVLKENVIWLLSLTSRAWNTTSTNIVPKKASRVLDQCLPYKHRNCDEIRDFLKTFDLIFQVI